MEDFKLIELPFGFSDLEPVISEKTLKVHYEEHHQTYCDKFNVALEELGVESREFKEIFASVSDKPAIRNMGGGFWNHNFYWEGLCAVSNSSFDGDSEIGKKIVSSFGSYEEFVSEFSNKAVSLFGSGWTWLGVSHEGNLVIYNTPNQDNFMMDVCEVSVKPVLVIDVWEHAYYLDFQNRRPEHVEKFFEIINWKKVNERFLELD